ncbi:uncharacterized protein BDR25DRAFT_325952 [Lindgomyces ingoldianus]|uniref:Uncharacterized protein n=1 Tax=Lindgomyces ingoldianus TaxID=673940 RepID=A0ACB6QUD0_9PLEO|nr:uncharacterized protein BDR25DRAFT_325952 [Lindgomyces ingoldianus]KAF2469776.1 hypothetical protein BDR25DRAFT_325952 [Lindgomyces ingoldianus]
MFGTLKKALSRRGSNPLSSSKSANLSPTSPSGHLATPRSNNPFSSRSPATRRPNSSTPLNEPPPAYTAGPAAPANREPPVTSTVDDPFHFLRTFNTIFLIDDSGSMAGRSWRETGKALELITPICTQRDADGIDIYFLNHPDSDYYKNVTLPGTVVEIFQNVRPSGSTPTGQRLYQILRPYLNEYEKARENEKPKPLNIIVITDGEPSDDVESPIIEAAEELDQWKAPAWQVGIQFFQVGKEPGAREHLKLLDDKLREFSGNPKLRDIVDTVPFTGNDHEELTAAGILKAVLGAVTRRLDRRSKELHRAKDYSSSYE